MGAWGHGIFDDDTANDVRDDYQRLVSESRDSVAATDALLQKWRDTIGDPDEGPVFWLALALTQHKLGRLEERVNREALKVLDQSLGLERWREQGAAELKRRQAQLVKVRALLLSPQPAPRKIRPPFKDSCAWKVGELVAYRLKSENWIALRVVTHETHAHGVAPVCELLEWSGPSAPSIDDLRDRPVRQTMLSAWSLFQLLSRNAPEYASEPPLAMKKLLAEMGLIDPATAGFSMAGILDPARAAPPANFDWAGHLKQMEKAIDRLRAGDAAVEKSLRNVARRRMPTLLNPISQISLRREPGLETIPARRLKRLKATLPPSSPGEWLVTRWYELDEVLDDIFQLK